MPDPLIPHNIGLTLRKGRGERTAEERKAVKIWLNEDRQLKYFLALALRNLGYFATTEDAEEAWQEFCARDLDYQINYYDPEAGKTFWNFLQMVFRQFCWKEAKKITRRNRVLVPLDMEVVINEDETIELIVPDPDPNVDPEHVVEERERNKALVQCINNLSQSDRNLIIRIYFDDQTAEEIAEKEGVPGVTIRQRHLRVRKALATCMREKGWDK